MRSLLVLLVLYIGIYALLSARGGWVGDRDRGLLVWQPMGARLDLDRVPPDRGFVVDADTAGWILLPAILVDRALVHRTRLHPEAVEAGAPRPPGSGVRRPAAVGGV